MNKYKKRKKEILEMSSSDGATDGVKEQLERAAKQALRVLTGFGRSGYSTKPRSGRKAAPTAARRKGKRGGTRRKRS